MSGGRAEGGTLKAIVNSAADAIVTADAEGRIVTWNPAAHLLFGHEEEAVLGEKLSILVPERFRQAHEQGLSRVVRTGETKIIGHTVDVFGLHRDGHEFPIELSLATWLEGDDRYFSGIIRDTSERAEMTAALATSERRMQAILDSANDAIVSIDKDGKVILWNPRAMEMFGYTDEEMMGQPMSAVIPDRFREKHLEGVTPSDSRGRATRHRANSRTRCTASQWTRVSD